MCMCKKMILAILIISIASGTKTKFQIRIIKLSTSANRAFVLGHTATEIFEMSERFGIEVDDLRAPLDEEERSRIEVEDNYTLILVDVPMIEERNDKDWYGTIPLGIIVTKKMIFTVCLEDTQVLTRFMEGRVRNFFTYMKTRFILQILYRNATMYLHYLRIIDKKSEQVEEKLQLDNKRTELQLQTIILRKCSVDTVPRLPVSIPVPAEYTLVPGSASSVCLDSRSSVHNRSHSIQSCKL